MKLWRLFNPLDYFYYQAEAKSFKDQSNENKVIKILPNSEQIGDFTWTGFDDQLVVKKNIAAKLDDLFKGFSFAKIDIVCSDKKIVSDLVLLDMVFNIEIEADLEKSTFKTSSNGKISFTGCEQVISKPDLNSGKLILEKVAREKGCGIFIKEENLENIDFFNLKQLNGRGWIFCTDKVKRFVEESNLTNIDFLEVGETF